MLSRADNMTYTTKCINANFRIKVYGIINGTRIDKLVGVKGLLELIGAELANKFITKALKCGMDKFIAKLRRGIKITFYFK